MEIIVSIFAVLVAASCLFTLLLQNFKKKKTKKQAIPTGENAK